MFAETHLKAQSQYEGIRERDVQTLIKQFALGYLEKNVPVIVAGDFNDVPHSKPVNLMEQYFIDLYQTRSSETFRGLNALNEAAAEGKRG